jgi:hypothetical protein
MNVLFVKPPQPLGVYRGLTITLRHTTLGMTPLDEFSVGRRDIYLTTHDIHKRHLSIPPAVFEPAIPENGRPNTHTLNRAATGIGCCYILYIFQYIDGETFK